MVKAVRAVLLGWVLVVAVATAYAVERARLLLLDDELALPVLLLGLLLALLLGQLAVVPAAARRARRPGRARARRPAAVFPGRAPGTPAACPFSLSPIVRDPGR